jgi:hypothetical protein
MMSLRNWDLNWELLILFADLDGGGPFLVGNFGFVPRVSSAVRNSEETNNSNLTFNLPHGAG